MRAEIPEPDSDDPKELYAFSGLALYAANLLEHSLVNIVVAVRISDGSPLTSNLINEAHSQLDRFTMDQLINRVREIIHVEEDLDQRLIAALRLRNNLAHHFFVGHDDDILSDTGRRQMIIELRAMMKSFKELDKELEEIYIRLWDRLAFTQEVRDQIFEMRVRHARQRDEQTNEATV